VLLAVPLCASLVAGGLAATAPNVEAIVLKASQVGAGYRASLIAGGRQVAGEVTLDLCDYTFASESQRIARIQEEYIKSATLPAVSNEVVAYRPGGTAAAFSELQHAARTCPPTPRTGPDVGDDVPTTFHLTKLTAPHLTASYVAVRIYATATVNGQKQAINGDAIYQFSGNIMSAVYGYGQNTTAMPFGLGKVGRLVAASESSSARQRLKQAAATANDDAGPGPH
jgi:hypothetical protein